MLIASRDRRQIINIDNLDSLFMNNDKRIIGISQNGRNTVIDGYETREQALKAMKILMERIRVATDKTNIIFMPTDEEMKAVQAENKEHYHHIDGRKTKGHGGS